MLKVIKIYSYILLWKQGWESKTLIIQICTDMFKKPYSKVCYAQPFPRCQIAFPWFPQSQGQILQYPDHNCGIEHSAEMHKVPREK